MIVYNTRYRGPLEYDKYALNILQYHNEIHHLIDTEMNSSSMSNLVYIKSQIDAIYDSIIGTSSAAGISESFYLNTLTMKEC